MKAFLHANKLHKYIGLIVWLGFLRLSKVLFNRFVENFRPMNSLRKV